jgi:hypothetical protein
MAISKAEATRISRERSVKEQKAITEEDERQIAAMEAHIDAELAAGRRMVYVLGVKTSDGRPYIEHSVALAVLLGKYRAKGWGVHTESDHASGDNVYFS